MTLPVTLPTVGQTYDRIRATLKAAKQRRLPAYAGEAATQAVIWLRDEVIPYLSEVASRLPPSANFPAEWVAALEAHAAAQMPLSTMAWVEAYDATGDAVRSALAVAEGLAVGEDADPIADRPALVAALTAVADAIA